MKHTLCIAEWQRFGIEDIEQALCFSINKGIESAQNMPKEISERAKKIFRELKDFADAPNNHIFLNSYGRNYLRARNYVGLIQTKSGFSLEILPKTFKAGKNEGFELTNCICTENRQEGNAQGQPPCSDAPCKVCQAKRILLNMLKTLKDSPFKHGQPSPLSLSNLPLFEVFIIMFITELERLVKRGIKGGYHFIEKNRRYIKGKLLFNENLAYNLAHKEWVYTLSDEWSMNIAPNRLIVSTLCFFGTQNLSLKTGARLHQLKCIFDGIPSSNNVETDFTKCYNSRHCEAYTLILLWCEIFLKRKTFSPYRGDAAAFALLFPMEKLFESYAASEIKRKYTCFTIKTQEKNKFLCTYKSSSIALLKPDIVGYNDGKPVFIADSKWKILDTDESKNFGIAQSDFYQLFAYLAAYKVQKAYLVYPKIEGLDLSDLYFTFKPTISDAPAKLVIKFLPLIGNKKSYE